MRDKNRACCLSEKHLDNRPGFLLIDVRTVNRVYLFWIKRGGALKCTLYGPAEEGNIFGDVLGNILFTALIRIGNAGKRRHADANDGEEEASHEATRSTEARKKPPGIPEGLTCQMVRLARFEPATHGLEGRCSIQLSY